MLKMSTSALGFVKQVLRKVNVGVEIMQTGVGSPQRTVAWVWESGRLELDIS